MNRRTTGSLLAGLGALLVTGAAQAQITVTNAVFGSVAVDYQPTATLQYSLQGTLGQDVVTLTSSYPTLPTPGNYAYGGFWETGVKFRYKGIVNLEEYLGADSSGTTAGVPVTFKLWNTSEILADTVTVPLDATGNYTLDSWANPTFIAAIVAKSPISLANREPLNNPANPLLYPGANLFLKGGDGNGDNSADALDLADLITSFNIASPDPGYNPLADYNGDLSNDALDLAILITNFNTEGDFWE